MLSKDADLWSVLRGLEGVDDKLLEHPAFAQLPSLLEDGEIPEGIAWKEKVAVYIATNHRIIHFKMDFWKKSISKVVSYLYNDIKTFRAESGFMALGCVMLINDCGNRKAQTLLMALKTRQRFAAVVRSHVSAHQTDSALGSSSPPVQATTPPRGVSMSDMTLRDINIPFIRVVKILFTWSFALLVVTAILAIPVLILWVILIAVLLSSL